MISCYEAGYDGFWLHRLLEGHGVRNQVIDPASLQVDRRVRRAKTDRIDAARLLRSLMAHARGEPKVWSVVRVPSVAEEDDRRLHRERDRLINERGQHVNRIKGLCAVHGIYDDRPDVPLSERERELINARFRRPPKPPAPAKPSAAPDPPRVRIIDVPEDRPTVRRQIRARLRAVPPPTQLELQMAECARSTNEAANMLAQAVAATRSAQDIALAEQRQRDEAFDNSVVAAGQSAWARLKKSRPSLSDGRLTGNALLIGRKHCMVQCNISKPRDQIRDRLCPLAPRQRIWRHAKNPPYLRDVCGRALVRDSARNENAERRASRRHE
jgi:transposase